MASQFRASFDDMARQSELDELRAQVSKLKTEATKPMTDLDYKSYGIEFPKDPLAAGSNIEDVGAAPPKLDTPAAASATAAPAVQEAPALAPASRPTDTV